MAAPKDTRYPEDEAHAESKGLSLLDSSRLVDTDADEPGTRLTA